MKIRIPRKVIEQARVFATQVFEARNQNPDKFTQGDELAADLKGFEAEFAHCFAYRQPFPQLKKGREVDKGYDTIMVLNKPSFHFKVDIKNSPKLLLNKKQYERSRADVYLFETIDYINWEQDIIYLKIHGWIKSSMVTYNSEKITYPNGSTAYKINKKYLNNPRKLYALYQPTEEKKHGR